ncbi:hypothetical protein [Pseudarthrobacter sp. N5]|uniref:hypothetical protein n=1 Tax=Pseudarthrobacter sp. N5 TaxID=3418416 RepID=UPI003CEB7080
MRAVTNQPHADATQAVRSPRRSFARIAGAALAVTFLLIMVEHGGAALVAGQRVSGTSDVGAIRLFYGHPVLQLFFGLAGIGFIAMVFFGLSFRAYLRTFPLTAVEALLVDFATAAIVLEAALIAIQIALQAALVQVVTSGTDGGVLALFASWDWIYNGSTYWFEVTWMAAWAFIALRTGALPKWIAIAGGIGATSLLFNTTVLTFRIPDSYTLVPTAVLVVWMVATLTHLARGGTQN